MAATILVVEDNNDLRELYVEILVEAGYAVLAAGNGAEGLDLARRHLGEVNLVLTDMVMPEMGGAVLMDRLRVDNPRLGVVLMSGHWHAEPAPSGGDQGTTEFLQKPFTATELLARIEHVLDSDGQPT